MTRFTTGMAFGRYWFIRWAAAAELVTG